MEQELYRLKSNGVIVKVERSKWAAPIVVVPKANGSIRICGDYKVTINKVVEDTCYPLPTAADFFAKLARGKVFTRLDLSNVYQQPELSEESKEYLTANTHKGLFQYQRLAYGISTPLSIFQYVIDQVLSGLDHVTCYLDDIFTASSNQEKHETILEEVLQRLERHNIRVYTSKCSFMEASVEYLAITKMQMDCIPKRRK